MVANVPVRTIFLPSNSLLMTRFLPNATRTPRSFLTQQVLLCSAGQFSSFSWERLRIASLYVRTDGSFALTVSVSVCSSSMP